MDNSVSKYNAVKSQSESFQCSALRKACESMEEEVNMVHGHKLELPSLSDASTSETAHAVRNMQLWQQQLMFKQLQERQRQQQLQQLDQGARQLPPHSQFSAVARPAAGNQLPVTLNEMPNNDACNYMWPNNFVGGISNLSSNSQMLIAGNMNLVQPSCSAAVQNLANGVIISNDQSQAMRSMGFMPQQIDQSFHGLSVSSTSSVDQYSHFLGMPNNCHNMMSKAAATIVEKASYPSGTSQSDQQSTAQGCLRGKTLATQNCQGRHVLISSSAHVLGNDVMSGNFHQLNSDQFQEVHGRQQLDDSSGKLREKPVSQVETSVGVSSLDPIEQKLLFGTDDDDNWGTSFGGSLIPGMGGDMHGQPLENDYYGSFPSIHSGSWSALMQEAVQASSSDKGLQEEWSGLSFQKAEQLMVKPLITTNDNAKQPVPWDNSNLQSATSLTSRPFPSFYDANATPSSSTAPSNQQFLEPANEENSMVLAEAPHASFKSSSHGANNKEFIQSLNQTKLVEGGLQAQMPSASGVWGRQTIEQCENSSSNIQFKSKDIGGGWGGQQNLPLSNVPIEPVNRLSDWNSSYPIASRADNSSNYHESHINLWKIGEDHVNLNSGLQPVKSDIGSPKMQAEDSSAGNFGSIMNQNTLKLNQDMHQQVINEQKSVFGGHFSLNTRVSSEGDKDFGENQNQPSRRPQTWELSVSAAAETLGDNYEKEKEHGRVVSGKGYAADAAKEKSLLSNNNQYPFVSGSLKSSIQCSQHTVGFKMSQSSQGNFGKMQEPSFPPNHLLSFQGLSNSVFHGSNSEEQSFSGKSQFSGHTIRNDPADVSERAAIAADLQSRNTIPVCAASSSFDGSTKYSQNETIAQDSNNMLELLHKVDQTRNGNSGNAFDMPTQAAADIFDTPSFDQSSNLRGFGLRLAPPSQRQPLSNYAPTSQKSLNDIKSGQSDYEAGYQDQARSNSTSSVQPVVRLDEASKIENWDKISSLSVQKHNEHSEANKYFNSSSATASDFPLVGNQLQDQQQLQQQEISSVKDYLEHQQQQRHQQYISNTTSHEVLDQSINFSFGNQANASALVKNASLIRQLHDSHDGAVAGQSAQTSLPSLAGRFLTSGVASVAETHLPVGSQMSLGGTDHTNPTFAGFSQITGSNQKLPVVETKSGSQSSISGMSQQAGFSKMLHNVWTNISAQQCQAGINPLHTPNVLQSIINHGRDTNSWGLPNAGNQVHKEEIAPPEVGTSSANSQKEENPLEGQSLNFIQMEKVDVVCKSRNASQGGEAVIKSPLDGGSSVLKSSLVRLHQQDVNKAKNGQDPALSSRVVHAPPTSIVSSSSDIGISGRMSKPSDVQHQNYSLLHQIQSMKSSDSDLNKMTGNLPKGAAFASNTSQMNFNKYQRFDHGQNSVSRFPADSKVGAASQISIPSDAKMVSFASNDNEGKNPSTSTAGRHDLQTHTHSLSTSSMANVLGSSEHTQISPQMAPSWFEHYGTYQNGRMVALYDAQRSAKAAIQQYLLQKPHARIDDSNVVEQRLDSSLVGVYRRGTLATKIAPNESSSSLLPRNVMDHDIVLRSKKRKVATADLPWHKMVAECPQRLQSISMAELDWTQAANRLMEKVDDEAETVEDDPLLPQSRRRLILTTQLMHQLLPAVPALVLKGEAASACGSVTFSVAKSALADACSLAAFSKSDSHVPLENENMTFGELQTSKKVGDDTFSKFVEDFIGRSKKLESDFSRLDKGTSMLDVRLECQELERFSIVNRLGKFHGRTHADGVKVSSASETAHRRTFPQRYITALPAPGNLPEGVFCLSL